MKIRITNKLYGISWFAVGCGSCGLFRFVEVIHLEKIKYPGYSYLLCDSVLNILKNIRENKKEKERSDAISETPLFTSDSELNFINLENSLQASSTAFQSLYSVFFRFKSLT